MLLLNTLTLSMLDDECSLDIQKISPQHAAAIGATESVTSAVGIKALTAIFGDILGIQVSYSRAVIKIAPGSTVLVGNYSGPHLKEEMTEIPEGGRVSWYLVNVLGDEPSKEAA